MLREITKSGTSCIQLHNSRYNQYNSDSEKTCLTSVVSACCWRLDTALRSKTLRSVFYFSSSNTIFPFGLPKRILVIRHHGMWDQSQALLCLPRYAATPSSSGHNQKLALPLSFSTLAGRNLFWRYEINTLINCT